jgi:hypothetical protein
MHDIVIMSNLGEIIGIITSIEIECVCVIYVAHTFKSSLV